MQELCVEPQAGDTAGRSADPAVWSEKGRPAQPVHAETGEQEAWAAIQPIDCNMAALD